MTTKFFPYNDIRPIQDRLIKEIHEGIKSKKHMIIHAPTGIGKTVSVLSPALDIAEKEKKVIFFLTSRHTQHRIAVDTLKEIRDRHKLRIPVVDLIAKKFMCPVDGVLLMKSGEFIDFCKAQREDNKCEFFASTKKNSELTARAKKALEDIKRTSPNHVEYVTELCKKEKVCCYEVLSNLASDSKVIIADYNYIFAPYIREPFFKRIGKSLNDCIIIIDEAHNLVPRIRDTFTVNLNMFVVNRAIKESEKYHLEETETNLRLIKDVLVSLSERLHESNEIKNEAIVSREEFIDMIESRLKKTYGINKKDYNTLMAELAFASLDIIKKQKRSFVSLIARFLEIWQQKTETSVRIISTKEPKHRLVNNENNDIIKGDSASGNNEFIKDKETSENNNDKNETQKDDADKKHDFEKSGFFSASSISNPSFKFKSGFNSNPNSKSNIDFGKSSSLNLSSICLDPGIITKEVIENSYSTIIMSGTLTPTDMYKDLLGFPKNTLELVYPNPFPKENKLSMVIPETTTKFSKRNSKQFYDIAKITSDITNITPGNSFVFFPSYYLRDQVYKEFSFLSKKTCFIEVAQMTKQERTEMLDRFKGYKDSGAVMLGVIGGSFSEGIDLPGDLLKAVIVVGVPLQQPDLETKKLIEYYDKKFGKGWDYGYVFPAINKTMQAAGRCIRSESDRGIVVFLDERYAWENYLKCFPPELEPKITRLYLDRIKEFFKEPKTS